MKETLKITDEAYRSDMERLWRYARRYRDTTKYTGFKVTLQNWMLSCDGQNVKSGTDAGVDLTALLLDLPLQPTNSDLITTMAAAGVDVATELPVLLTFSFDVEYTVIE